MVHILIASQNRFGSRLGPTLKCSRGDTCGTSAPATYNLSITDAHTKRRLWLEGIPVSRKHIPQSSDITHSLHLAHHMRPHPHSHCASIHTAPDAVVHRITAKHTLAASITEREPLQSLDHGQGLGYAMCTASSCCSITASRATPSVAAPTSSVSCCSVRAPTTTPETPDRCSAHFRDSFARLA